MEVPQTSSFLPGMPALPCIMGILNVTPDSFSTVGRLHQLPEQALDHAEQMISHGAAIIDVGAEPTNPSLHPCISLQEELDRLMPVLEKLCQLPVPISVDTSKPEVMCEAIKAGVAMINDVRALQREGALAVVAQSEVQVCLMHMSFPEGKPSGVQQADFPQGVTQEVLSFLTERVKVCQQAGIQRQRIVIDPGLGFGNFGKTTADNLQLLRDIPRFNELGFPVLIGASRKTFIGDILQCPEQDRMAGSLAVAAFALQKGAAIIRCHDVKQTADVLKIYTSLTS